MPVETPFFSSAGMPCQGAGPPRARRDHHSARFATAREIPQERERKVAKYWQFLGFDKMSISSDFFILPKKTP